MFNSNASLRCLNSPTTNGEGNTSFNSSNSSHNDDSMKSSSGGGSAQKPYCQQQRILLRARSTSSVLVGTTNNATGFDSSMAPIESHSATCLNTLVTKDYILPPTKPSLQHQLSTPSSIQSGYSSATTNSSINECDPNFTGANRNKTEYRSLKHNSSSLNPVDNSTRLSSISPLRKSSSSTSGITAKNEQSSSVAATAASTSPTEKEKKRKEVSSSRVKKFHRHFTQVSKDEKLINYFSCALVSDILLQGHLYITDQHFAFYSNVFGYVTKVVIPTSSVTKISKEKTAKIIPNAVGVATADERHVFGSFISREAAFRLMCSVCPPLAPVLAIAKIPVDIEISEEYSIEDDSSCSISGNESPPQTLEAGAAAGVAVPGENGQTLVRRPVAGSSLSIAEGKLLRNSDIPQNAKSGSNGVPFSRHPNAGVRASAPPSAHYANNITLSTSPAAAAVTPSKLVSSILATTSASAATNLTMIIAGTASSSTSTSSSPSLSTASLPTTMAAGTTTATGTTNSAKTTVQAIVQGCKTLKDKALMRLKFPTELHVVYLGVMLSLLLALFSVFLLYRIMDIESKTGFYHSSSMDFHWRSGNDEEIFSEALRWQKELQTKSTEEAQNILNTNLEQIAKVRRSLETLSMLIHDRSSAYSTSLNRDDSD